MKKFKSILTAILMMISVLTNAQNARLAVVSFDANSKELQDVSMTELLRIEVAKHEKYEVVDRYEIAEILSQHDITAAACLSKSCLISAGQLLNVDYVVSGNVDHIGESLFIRIRIMNVKSKSVEKEVVKEFLFIPEKINTMISICINELMGVPNDKTIEQSLSNRDSYESAINNPYFQTLNLSGPRMGYTFFVGENASILRKERSEGGYDAYPAMFQMGYQFETQYLNEGRWQALFEFIPLISGIDQGLLIPSFTIMNGLRNNQNGVEFAIGPTVNFVRQAKMFRDEEGNWQLANRVENILDAPESYRLDSRGEVRITTNVVVAAGFTLRSGKLNIPINAFVVPSQKNLRFGFSFGFNARK